MRSSFAVWSSLVALAGCSDGAGGTPDAAPREVVTDSRQLLVGEIAEAIMVGGPGDVAVISFAGSAAKLDWNIHGHADGSTQTVAEELGVSSVHYTFSPTAHADWYLLIRNRDTAPMTVQVAIELYGNLEWRGWQ